MRRKKVFLFVFLICLFFGAIRNESAFAQGALQTYTDPNTGITYMPNGTKIGPDGKVIPPKEEPPLASRITTGIIAGFINLISPLIALIAQLTAWLASIFVNIGTELLRISLEIGIINLSKILSNDGIQKLWETFRNLGNIALVFILMFIAITTILQTKGYETNQLLGKVIVAAVLMNFSFFFGAIIVDVSNIMSLNIYQIITEKEEIQKAGSLGKYINEKAGAGIFAQQIGISTGISRGTEPTQPGTAPTVPKEKESWFSQQLKKAVGYIMLTILDIVLAIILIIAAFSIIGRMVAIILLLLVSPIAFIAMILPKTRQTSSDWWQSIIGQSFYLPVFLLFLYVGIMAIEVISKVMPPTVKAAGIADFTGTISAAAPLIVQFAIVIGIFIAALIAANKISSQGSAVVNKIAGSVKSKVAGATIGGAALLGRNTVGYMSQRFADSELGKKIGSTRTGSLVLSGARKVGKSSFDLRGSRAFSGVASATGVGEKAFGAAQTGGFAEQEKRTIQRREQYARSLVSDISREEATRRLLNDNPNALTIENREVELAQQDHVMFSTARENARAALTNAINTNAAPAVIQQMEANLQQVQADFDQSQRDLTQATTRLNSLIDTERTRINNSSAISYAQRLEGAPTDPNNITGRDRLRRAGSWVTGRRSNTEAASRARRYLNRDQATRDREALAAAIRAANNP